MTTETAGGEDGLDVAEVVHGLGGGWGDGGGLGGRGEGSGGGESAMGEGDEGKERGGKWCGHHGLAIDRWVDGRPGGMGGNSGGAGDGVAIRQRSRRRKESFGNKDLGGQRGSGFQPETIDVLKATARIVLVSGNSLLLRLTEHPVSGASRIGIGSRTATGYIQKNNTNSKNTCLGIPSK